MISEGYEKEGAGLAEGGGAGRGHIRVTKGLKGPKHDQIECGFFYINPSSMDR